MTRETPATMRIDPDERLLGRLRAGDHEAFTELVRRHAARIQRLALGVLGNAEDAEDATQEAFLRLFRTVDRFRGEAPLRVWLLRIALHCARDQRRRRLRRREVAGAEPLSAAASEDPGLARAERRDDLRLVFDALAQLPERQRAALLLKVEEGLSHREIAQVLGTTDESARVYVSLARRTLRRRLARRLLEEEGES